jgi:hypothetical protein
MRKSLGMARALFAITLFVACVAAAAGNEWDLRSAGEARVLIEGWTEYLHSWSIVNAHQLVHLQPFAAPSPSANENDGDSDDEATECALPASDDGARSHSRAQRQCRLRLHLFEMPPYIEHWTKARPAFMLHSDEHAARLRSVPRVRAAKPLPDVSQGYIPPSSHYYDLIRMPSEPDDDDEPAVERFELRWRFDAIFRIAAPVNMYLPTPPASTRRRIIVSPVRFVLRSLQLPFRIAQG